MWGYIRYFFSLKKRETVRVQGNSVENFLDHYDYPCIRAEIHVPCGTQS